jgi:hypothetical protein
MSTEQQTDFTPRPNPIIAEPATPEACQADYAAAADVRARLDTQDARQH